MANEKKALKKLLSNTEIPEAFYYYWNDAVNSIGYSAKLLLMLSAIEALVRRDNQKDLELLKQILGLELIEDLFNQTTGLRHRLIHGEYFGKHDQKKNYFELVHKKIITYFNSKIFQETLIHENVINPQRHFFGNKEIGRDFIKNKDKSNNFDLKELLKDFSKNGFRTPDNYEHFFDKALITTY